MNSLQTNKHGEGAIHVAAGLGQIDILKMLAAKGQLILKYPFGEILGKKIMKFCRDLKTPIGHFEIN